MKIKHFTLIVLVLAVFSSCQQTSTQVKIESQIDSVSYALGISMGQYIMNQDLSEIEVDAYTKGFKDIVSGNEPEIDPNDANNIINAYAIAKRNIEGEKYLEEGKKFLEENKSKEGVVVLESGLQYEVLTEGSGPIPKSTDRVQVHYKGSLVDGTVFESSYDSGEPIAFPVTGVIRGWQEALQLMSVGSKWKLFIPSDLAYGANPRPGGPIKPNMALIFEVELLSIDSAE